MLRLDDESAIVLREIRLGDRGSAPECSEAEWARRVAFLDGFVRRGLVSVVVRSDEEWEYLEPRLTKLGEIAIACHAATAVPR